MFGFIYIRIEPNPGLVSGPYLDRIYGSDQSQATYRRSETYTPSDIEISSDLWGVISPRKETLELLVEPDKG